ncbi:polysaccharide deacetylase family protein [Actinomadura rupiterrae]|uniref:polysaccharide deacetylase family protein n=1 Tax=Actinomadura rupiterrae TaxID=559627 RepID=UPI0020A40CDC|nr:polysaccharide deacetylase family protein [Actinomadura rupiterrae]MCP2338082.1 peptidoglycan/xylan/chitin deacetylase (PgdA/CDA1 family) [Actinomadura rupiterrae]
MRSGEGPAPNGVGAVVGRAGAVVNLTVHGIGPRPGRALDPGEDGTWVDVDRFERVLDAVAGRPEVRLTFDDGNASDLEIALPRLLARGLTAEFYVLAGRLGEPGRLTADGVRELAKSGMSIGSHGWAHRDWRRLTSAQVGEELVHAHRVLEDITGEPVTRVAVPFGSYDRHVLRRLQRAAVDRVYTSDGGPSRPDAWLQPRTSLRHDLDDAWIARVLAPPAPALRLRRTAARLVKRFRGR